jgi:integrase/recombinase XerD
MGGAKTYRIMNDLSGYFKQGERERIYNHLKSDRDKLLIKLLWKTGRRITEILMVKVKDIDFDDTRILWNIEKKRKGYKAWKPIDENTMFEICIYISNNNLPEDSFLFPSYGKLGHLTRIRVYQILEKACEELKIFYVGSKKPHPHHFRHSFAIDKAKKLKSPADMRKLQQYLEHSNLGMTENYLQFGSGDLRSIVDD